jgi:hypothetical protein
MKPYLFSRILYNRLWRFPIKPPAWLRVIDYNVRPCVGFVVERRMSFGRQ